MKTLILSDIHSNIIALETIWQKEKDSDLIFCAGDLVDYGPHPRAVIDWIIDHHVCCVKGNHDWYLAHCYRSGLVAERVPLEERAWVHHNAGLLEERHILFLEELPEARSFELDGIEYGMTHLYRDYNEIVSLQQYQQFQRQVFVNRPSITRLILGHTHRLSIRYLSDTLLWLNPGSVSYRRRDDPDQTAHYATITDGKISLKRIPYDLTELRRDVKQVVIKDSELEQAHFYFGARE